LTKCPPEHTHPSRPVFHQQVPNTDASRQVEYGSYRPGNKGFDAASEQNLAARLERVGARTLEGSAPGHDAALGDGRPLIRSAAGAPVPLDKDLSPRAVRRRRFTTVRVPRLTTRFDAYRSAKARTRCATELGGLEPATPLMR